MRNRIYYYKLATGHGEGPAASVTYFHEVILIKAARRAPTTIWINNVLLKSTKRTWQKVPGEKFSWWWDWFKKLKATAVERKELTKLELFEIIGLQNL